MRRWGAALMLAGAFASVPAGAAPACLLPDEATSLALVAMPEIIRETGSVCADRLPATSLVRRADGPFLAKYDAAAERAWPAARGAIVKLSDPMVEVLLQSQYARPLLVNLLVPQIAGRIAPADCGMIDRLVTDLAPLPPRNAAGVVVTALLYLRSEKARGKPVDLPDLPLCPDPQRTADPRAAKPSQPRP